MNVHRMLPVQMISGEKVSYKKLILIIIHAWAFFCVQLRLIHIIQKHTSFQLFPNQRVVVMLYSYAFYQGRLHHPNSQATTKVVPAASPHRLIKVTY